MIQKHFEDITRKKFGYDFSPTQQIAVEHFIRFFFAREEEGIFLLKGYAGTGKTSLVAAIVNALVSLEYKVVLLAPTGRAAKVFAGYAGQAAFTIHKKIYRQKSSTDGEGLFNLGFNAGADTLFFVDEASMISNADGEGNFGSGCLLDDLIQYIYNGRNNRLILIGDVAQLPPVGLDISPALDRRELEAAYNFKVTEVALTDIMRQAEQSGILYNATQVRSLIGIGSENLRLRIGKFPDVFKIGGGELLEEIDSCYGRFGEEETIVVCRSNKRANIYNKGIRAQILYREDELNTGDMLMVAKNNYYWTEKSKEMDFIANGEIAVVRRVRRTRELYEFRFAEVVLTFPDHEDFELEANLLLDTLHSDAPALPKTENDRLFYSVLEDYADIPVKRDRMKKMKADPHYNALQVKYAYAVTCHKAQGGQWQNVFLDQGYMTDEYLTPDYFRWLYTAFTRATRTLYLVNYPKEQWI